MKNWKHSIPSTDGYSFTLLDGGKVVMETDDKEELIQYMNDNHPNAKWIPPSGSERVKYFEERRAGSRIDLILTKDGGQSYLYGYHIDA